MATYAIAAMRRTKLMIGGRILALAIQFTLARDAAGQQATSQLGSLLDRQSEIALVTSAYQICESSAAKYATCAARDFCSAN